MWAWFELHSHENLTDRLTIRIIAVSNTNTPCFALFSPTPCLLCILCSCLHCAPYILNPTLSTQSLLLPLNTSPLSDSKLVSLHSDSACLYTVYIFTLHSATVYMSHPLLLQTLCTLVSSLSFRAMTECQQTIFNNFCLLTEHQT